MTEQKKRKHPAKYAVGYKSQKDHTEDGDNAKYIHHTSRIRNLEPLRRGGKSNNSVDPSDLKERVELYFKICEEDDVKPVLAELAMACGVSREVFIKWAHGTGEVSKNSAIQAVAQSAIQTMESMTVRYAMDGKTNVVFAIFLLKNNYGYKDSKEIQEVPASHFQNVQSLEQLQAKYAIPADFKTHKAQKAVVVDAEIVPNGEKCSQKQQKLDSEPILSSDEQSTIK